MDNWTLSNQLLGAKNISDQEQFINEFKTPLFKEYHISREAVLHMMYVYRKERFQKAMLVITDGLLHTMANINTNKHILKYMLTMEPPAYTC